jgi:hypothetical protein
MASLGTDNAADDMKVEAADRAEKAIIADGAGKEVCRRRTARIG